MHEGCGRINIKFCNVQMKLKMCQFKLFNNYLINKEKAIEPYIVAAQKAYDRFYLAVGKSVVKKLMWIIGASAFACWLYFKEGQF